MLKTLLKVEFALFRVTLWLIYCIYTVIIVSTFAAVFSRYVLNDSIIWAEELARYLFIWVAFLGSALALKNGAHIGLDLIISSLPPTVKTVVEGLITILIGVFLAFVITASVTVVEITMGNTSSALGIPMGMVYLAIPVGCSLMFLSSCRKLLQIFRPDSKSDSENEAINVSQPYR